MNQNFMYSLEIMGKGMASIFVVIILLTFIVMLLAFLTNLGNKKEDNVEEA